MSYADEFIKRAMRIERLVEGESLNSAKSINELKKDILKHVRIISSTTALNRDKNKAIKELSSKIKNAFKKIELDSVALVEIMIEKEILFNSDIMAAYGQFTVSDVKKGRVFNRIFDSDFHGKTFSQWYGVNSKNTERRVKSYLRRQFQSGIDINKASKEVGRITNRSASETKTILRSNLVYSANQVRQEIVQENSQLFEYKIWVSILDIRTTPHICGVRDGLRYTLSDEPIEHGEPWETGPGAIHFNCRSAWIPKIEGLAITAKRPAISAGDNYSRGDNLTNRGTVRKPRKANIEKGTYKIENRTMRGSYEGWLRTQPKDFIADALRSTSKADLFKKGAGLSELTNFTFGQPINITQF